MSEFLKSMTSFSWIMLLFGVKQFENILMPKDSGQRQDKSTAAFDAVTRATEEQLDGVLRDAFEAGNKLQRGLVDMMFSILPMEQHAQGSVDSGRLNTTIFIVLGEGLAAGMGNFTLSEATQNASFPAQMARQMQTPFSQPLIQAPGLDCAVGFAELPVRLPAYMQTTVLEQLQPKPFANLSVPEFKLADALTLRPSQPHPPTSP